MMDQVDITLKEWRQTKAVYGYSDCMMSLAKYAADCGGLDVRDRYTGKYDDHAGAVAAMKASGGIEGLMAEAECVRVDEPRRGDMVAIQTIDGEELGALYTGNGIAARLERGVVEVDERFVKIKSAWRVAR